jgi:hypothetical protein
LLARVICTTALVALTPLPAGAETPFASHCEGNVCYQGKVQTACLKAEARRLMRAIADRFGKIEVASACDGRHARRSAHYVGKAFDFRPYGASRAEIVAFLKASPDVGGVGAYPNGLIHADVGDRKMAWFGRGGRAWPIGIDRVGGGDASEPTAPSEPSAGGLAAALLAAFAPAKPSAAPDMLASAAAPPNAPSGAANAPRKAPGDLPLPPGKPAFLIAMAAAPDATAQRPEAQPTDFAVVLRGPIAPVEPIPLQYGLPDEVKAATVSPAGPSVSIAEIKAVHASAMISASAH